MDPKINEAHICCKDSYPYLHELPQRTSTSSSFHSFDFGFLGGLWVGWPCMCFTKRKSSMPVSPHSRALPLCLYPPKGASPVPKVPLTITVPDRSWRATARAFSGSAAATALFKP
mmetsp:Transcript_77578/g.146447  ORF Transcript_77578/g.146447 Transcript_77578/m.146447 type:complete len:115 (+) Transcript_77578:38-382(+)